MNGSAIMPCCPSHTTLETSFISAEAQFAMAEERVKWGREGQELTGGGGGGVRGGENFFPQKKKKKEKWFKKEKQNE